MAEHTSFQQQMLMDAMTQFVKKELQLTEERILTGIKSIFKDANQTSAQTNMKLKFMNKISPEILTGDEIKGEGNTPIKVAVVDDPTGNIIEVGPEASARVEIVVLKGEADASEADDHTDEEFNDKVVAEMEGKQPLLAGNLSVKLKGGIGVFEKIKFKHHASKIKPPLFKLGARMIGAFGGARIKEAKTESFTVRDYRNKYYQKKETPSPSDKVYGLVNIRKGGKIDKRLQKKGINTVGDFLIRLLLDPQELKNIVNLGSKKWEAIVKNARACAVDSKKYCYINLEQNIGVVFNVLGQVQGLHFGSHYCETRLLTENNKVYAQELLANACKNWKDVKSSDDVNSFQQHFAGGSHENVGTSVMIGDFGPFSIDDMEIKDDAVMQHNTRPPLDLDSFCKEFCKEFDELTQQNDSCNSQPTGVINESNANEQGAATVVPLVEPKVVHTTNQLKRWRWKTLFCVSRWFSVRKKVSVDVTRKQKKQKVF